MHGGTEERGVRRCWVSTCVSIDSSVLVEKMGWGDGDMTDERYAWTRVDVWEEERSRFRI